MTLPAERTSTITQARRFLLDLLDPVKTPRVPQPVRREAHRLLRHYPSAYDIHRASKWAADVFGPVPERPFGEDAVEMSDFTFTIKYQQTENGCSQDELIGRFSGLGFAHVLDVPGQPGILALQLTCAAGNGQDAMFTTLQAFREVATDATLIDLTEHVLRVGSDIPPRVI